MTWLLHSGRCCRAVIRCCILTKQTTPRKRSEVLHWTSLSRNLRTEPWQDGTSDRSKKQNHGNRKQIGITESSYSAVDKKKTNKVPAGGQENAKWSDTFGTLAEEDTPSESHMFNIDENLHDVVDAQKDKTPYEHIPLGRYNRKHEPRWYANKVLKLGKEGKVREAIEVFDKWMIKEDRVRPEKNNYYVLIQLLADCGYVTKAFQLYNQMLRFGHGLPSPALYTCLFNACANSPLPRIGLQKATELRQQMLLKGEKPNYITYQAMIKAFGLCGDINTAFQLADEAAQIKITDNLLSSLLGACVHDKEAGFRHAVLVWRKFQKMGIKPTLLDYNLLLRAVNECGVGKQGLTPELLKSPDVTAVKGGRKGQQNLKKVNRKQLETFKQFDSSLAKYEYTSDVSNEASDSNLEQEPNNQSAEGTDVVPILNDSIDTKEWWQLDIFSKSDEPVSLQPVQPQLPNILELTEDFTDVIEIGSMKKNDERFALLGGLHGFLQTLEKENIQGDIVTFTQLVKSVPKHQENDVIIAMKVAGVRPDTDFYNHLIFRRSKFYKDEAFAAWRMIKFDGLKPNLRTFGCLSLACDSKERGDELLLEMEATGLVPNARIFSQLLVANSKNFLYQKELLKKIQEYGIKPSPYVIQAVENSIAQAKDRLAKMKQSGGTSSNTEKKLEKSLHHFLLFYDKWTQHNVMEEKQHPWQSFKQSTAGER